MADRRRSGRHLGPGDRPRRPRPAPRVHRALPRTRRAPRSPAAPLASLGTGAPSRAEARGGVEGSVDRRRAPTPGAATSPPRAAGQGHLRRRGGPPRRARRARGCPPARRHGIHGPRARLARAMGTRGRLGSAPRRRGLGLLDRARVGARDHARHRLCESASDPRLAGPGRANRGARARRAPPRARRLARGPSHRHAEPGGPHRSARRDLARAAPPAACDGELGGRTAREPSLPGRSLARGTSGRHSCEARAAAGQPGGGRGPHRREPRSSERGRDDSLPPSANTHACATRSPSTCRVD